MKNNEVGAEICRTMKILAADRVLLETNWYDAYQYTFPLRGQNILSQNDSGFTNANQAFDDKAEIFDTTGSDAARLLASSMLSGLTPPNSKWFTLKVPDIDKDTVSQDAKEWLQSASSKLFNAIHASNYDSEAFEFMIDMVVGGFAGLYTEITDDGDLMFEAWPLDSLYLEETMKRGIVDTVYRTMMMTAPQAVHKFGIDNVPEKIRKSYKEGKAGKDRFEFTHCIRPRVKNGVQATGTLTNNLPFESIYVAVETKTIVKESGYHEFPAAIARWMKIPRTPYAVGAIDTALPDIKTLNRVVQMMLTNAEMSIAGTFVATHDGVINQNTLRIGPRSVIFAANVNNIKPLGTAGNFAIAGTEIDRLQSQIKRTMMSDQLSPPRQSGNPASATEIRARVQMIRQTLGPVYGRFSNEYLQILLTRCFGLLLRDGQFGEPPAELMDGTAFIPEYTSPLARAQRLEEVLQQDAFEASLANMAQIKPELLDLYKFDEAARMKAEAMNINYAYFRTESEVKKLRADRAAAQQQAEQQLQQTQELQDDGQAIQNEQQLNQVLGGEE